MFICIYIYIHMFIYLFVFISIFILSYISLVFQSYLLRCGIPFAWYPFGVQENTEPKNQVFVSASLGLKRLLKYESTPSDVLLVLRINRLFLPLCKVGWIRRSPLVGETTQLTNFGSLRSVPAGHPSTPQKTNIFFLKIDGWKMTFPFKTVPLTFVFCIPPKKNETTGIAFWRSRTNTRGKIPQCWETPPFDAGGFPPWRKHGKLPGPRGDAGSALEKWVGRISKIPWWGKKPLSLLLVFWSGHFLFTQNLFPKS